MQALNIPPYTIWHIKHHITYINATYHIISYHIRYNQPFSWLLKGTNLHHNQPSFSTIQHTHHACMHIRAITLMKYGLLKQHMKGMVRWFPALLKPQRSLQETMEQDLYSIWARHTKHSPTHIIKSKLIKNPTCISIQRIG